MGASLNSLEKKAEIDDLSKFKNSKGNCIFYKDDLFRNNYLIGQSMGSGYYGEVRKCKQIKSGIIRAVKIYKKEKMQ